MDDRLAHRAAHRRRFLRDLSDYEVRLSWQRVASITFAVGFAVFQHDHVYVMAGGIFMGALCVFMHRANILRLIHGEERKTNLFGKGSKS